jgi:hypothetical protein
MSDLTLSQEEFDSLAQARLQLRSSIEQLGEVLSERALKRLKSASESLDEGTARLITERNQRTDAAMDYWCGVQKKHGLSSIWSIFDVGVDCDTPHQFDGATHVRYACHWGEAGEVVVPIEGSTWLDLYRAADAAISSSGDSHHAFIEGFRADGESGVLDLVTGS